MTKIIEWSRVDLYTNPPWFEVFYCVINKTKQIINIVVSDKKKKQHKMKVINLSKRQKCHSRKSTNIYLGQVHG